MATNIKLKKYVLEFLTYAVLVLFVVIMVGPFYWMVTTALKTEADILKIPADILPRLITFQWFEQVLTESPILLGFWNSSKITIAVTVGTLLTSSMAAYSFAKIRFPGAHRFFLLFFSTMLVPVQVTLIPLFLIFVKIGWIDTHLPLIVPGVLLNAYGIFLLRQFMINIPDSYLEAAKIDGANHLTIYLYIMLPLVKPALITLGLFSFIINWNNYLPQLIFINSESKFTIPLIINTFRDAYQFNWGPQMAAATISVIPIIVIFLFTQKYFIQGIATTGLKG